MTACTAAPGLSVEAPSAGAPVAAGDAVAAAAAVASESPEPEPSAAATLPRAVPAGTVALAAGPFLDRVRLGSVHLGPAAVTATLDVISDVSEIIALEIRVAFYDAHGVLLGSSSQTFTTAETEPFHTTSGVVGLPILVPVPASIAAAGTHSAVLSIPVLVNE